MKRFVTIIGIMLILVACTNERSSVANQDNKKTSGQDASESSLKVKPAKLSAREQSLVNQLGGDYQTFYTVDGKVGEGEVLVTSIVVIKKGEQTKEALASVSGTGEHKKFNKDLHSFQLLMEKEATYLTIGSPNGFARGLTTIPDNIGSFLYKQPEEEVKVVKGQPVYLSYLIGSSQNKFVMQTNAGQTTLPKSVENAEYAVGFKVELKDEPDL